MKQAHIMALWARSRHTLTWKSSENRSKYIPVKRSKRFHVHSVSSFYSISISSVRQRKITGAVVSFSKAKKIYFSYSIHASLSQFSLSAWKHFNALFLLFPLFFNLSLCQTVFFSFESKCFWHFVTIINNFLLVYNFFASFSLCYLSSVDVKKKKTDDKYRNTVWFIHSHKIFIVAKCWECYTYISDQFLECHGVVHELCFVLRFANSLSITVEGEETMCYIAIRTRMK